jgi:hypothetical protein
MVGGSAGDVLGVALAWSGSAMVGFQFRYALQD